MFSGDVEEVVYAYDVVVGTGRELAVRIVDESIVRDGIVSADVYDLVCFDISVAPGAAGHSVVTVVVTLAMPETEEQYDAIAGAAVTFTLAFDRARVG
jgi:hypothetical protein